MQSILLKKASSKEMDPRVKPAGDASLGASYCTVAAAALILL
jgi:hypothetical protein